MATSPPTRSDIRTANLPRRRSDPRSSTRCVVVDRSRIASRQPSPYRDSPDIGAADRLLPQSAKSRADTQEAELILGRPAGALSAKSIECIESSVLGDHQSGHTDPGQRDIHTLLRGLSNAVAPSEGVRGHSSEVP